MVRLVGRAVAALFMFASAAFAADARAQLYVAGNFGVEFLNESDFTSSGSGTNGSGNLGYDQGFSFSGALGYSMGRFRVEGEAFYRWADLLDLDVTTSGMQLGTTTLTGSGVRSLTGDLKSYGALGSLYYDIYTGTGWVPYVGIGAGVANVALKIDAVGTTGTSFDENDWVLAYQAGFGVAYQINNSIAVSVGYRYFATTEATFSVSGTDNDLDLSAHVIQTGLRYRF
jgi:opacity protein-like surface antigen